MKKLIIATNNHKKVEEIRAAIGHLFELTTLEEIGFHEEIEETGSTLEENALLKARTIHERFGLNCFADDSGLEIEALNNEPGVYSARYAGEPVDHDQNITKVLHNLQGVTNRQARFRTLIALIIDGQEHLFEGSIPGTIRTERSGEKGFGYDPIFQPEGFSITFAEMDLDDKNRISHRGKAIKQMSTFLAK